MLKCEIIFDTDKILKEGEYTPDSIQKATDELFEDYDLVKGENGFYLEKGTDSDYVNFMGVIISLKHQNWFLDNLKKWVLYVDEDDTGDYYTEDLAERYAMIKQGA